MKTKSDTVAEFSINLRVDAHICKLRDTPSGRAFFFGSFEHVCESPGFVSKGRFRCVIILRADTIQFVHFELCLTGLLNGVEL